MSLMRPRRGLLPLFGALLLAGLLPAAHVAALSPGSLSLSVDHGGSVVVTLIAYGTSPVSPSSGTLIVDSQPQHGVLGTLGSTTCALGWAGCWATVTYTPDAEFLGDDSFGYRLQGDANVGSVTIHVKSTTSAPTTTADTLFLTPEDVDAYGPDDLDLNDTDPDGDDLVAELVDQAQHGTATVYPNGTYRYQGDPDYSSLADGGQPVTDSFTYRVSDGVHVSAKRTVNVWIGEVNDPPTFTSGGRSASPKTAGQRPSAGWASAIRAGSFYEDPHQTVSFTVTADDTALFTVQPAIAPEPDPGPAATSNLTFTPRADAFGSTTVTVVAKDDGGTVEGGDDTADAVTFTLTLTGVEDPPVASDHQAQTDEDTFVDVPVTNGASDPDGDALSVTVATDGTHGTTAIRPGNQLVRYTPAADWNGIDTFDYTLSDGHGGTVTRSVTVTVGAIDDPPSFTVGPDVTVAEDAGPQTLPGWANAISVGGPDEALVQTPVFSIAADDDPALFTTAPAVASNGTLTFRAKANTSGVANLTVRLSDGVAHVDHAFTIT